MKSENQVLTELQEAVDRIFQQDQDDGEERFEYKKDVYPVLIEAAKQYDIEIKSMNVDDLDRYVNEFI